MNITIAAGIDEPEKALRDQDPAYAQDESQRKRLYYLAPIREEYRGGWGFVKPIDKAALARQVTQVLEKRGFHAVEPGHHHHRELRYRDPPPIRIIMSGRSARIICRILRRSSFGRCTTTI